MIIKSEEIPEIKEERLYIDSYILFEFYWKKEIQVNKLE